MLWQIFLAGFYAVAATAQDTGPEVRLYVMNVPPYSLIGPERHGIVGDVALEAMRRSDLRPKIVDAPNARALHDVPNLSNTLIVPLARLKERETKFTWIARIITVQRAFYSMGKKVRSFADAKDKFKMIGVERGSAAHAILKSHGFPENRLVDVTLDAMAPKMLQAGRIDAWFGVVQTENPTEQTLVKSSVSGASTEQYLGCSRVCDPDLAKRLAGAVRDMEADGTVRKIVGDYR